MQEAVSIRLKGTREQLDETVAMLSNGARVLITNKRRLRGEESQPTDAQLWFYDGVVEAPLINERPRRVTPPRRDHT